MDAARLVAEAERAMRRNPQPEDVIAEAWQAYELTEAVGRLLAPEGGNRAEWSGGTGNGAGARDGGRTEWDGGGPDECGGTTEWGAGADHGRPVVRAGPGPVVSAGTAPLRALRLTAVRDPAGTLRALRVLLGEIGQALVALVCTAEDETAYWIRVEALDAVDEAKDRVRVLTLVNFV
ncbi:DUF6099 family protein [Streptomyces sp.]|uniref:DUF6099 family protein n=1 Tax=Streptomyces sp. TaxID=1931 RepID=UPI002F3E92A8